MSNRRLVVNLTVALCLSFALVAMAQEGMMPQPGPEHQALGFFAGKWNFEGETKETPMGPAGTITFTESCGWYEGGFAMVCRSEGKTPMGPTNAMGIMSYDTGKKAYTYYGMEANMPPFMAVGRREGKAWHYKSEAKMGEKTMMTRVTITETSSTSYSFEMEMSMDGGSTWTHVMKGKSTKSTT